MPKEVVTHSLKTANVVFICEPLTVIKHPKMTGVPLLYFVLLTHHFVLLSSMIACIQYVCIYVDTCVHMVRDQRGKGRADNQGCPLTSTTCTVAHTWGEVYSGVNQSLCIKL